MSWSSDQLTSNIDMADIDKIVCEAENCHIYKLWYKANSSQFKNFIYDKDFIYDVLLPLLVFISPIIVAIIVKVASI